MLVKGSQTVRIKEEHGAARLSKARDLGLYFLFIFLFFFAVSRNVTHRFYDALYNRKTTCKAHLGRLMFRLMMFQNDILQYFGLIDMC